MLELYRMFEDFIAAKYPDLSQKELFVKRADDYHLWVKDYICMTNVVPIIINI